MKSENISIKKNKQIKSNAKLGNLNSDYFLKNYLTIKQI